MAVPDDTLAPASEARSAPRGARGDDLDTRVRRTRVQPTLAARELLSVARLRTDSPDSAP